ncbi:hypothetical protein B0T26DRAFT_753326 [Lasiosphaeria miniovina]|uniref:Uncharacterized protein n=1 Tax=Lasiosphaeria miniovina TaxID=1954250 RepID=A0AA40AC58_9PEZI|nr:uncharacterized protein B0T26DRAFT_753326 [Lasiosphaeria miniovina]KAK0713187.1 hypothetical protein B0T26DRAFT_753326 [Lasiosphaeria miniovina]
MAARLTHKTFTIVVAAALLASSSSPRHFLTRAYHFNYGVSFRHPCLKEASTSGRAAVPFTPLLVEPPTLVYAEAVAALIVRVQAGAWPGRTALQDLHTQRLELRGNLSCPADLFDDFPATLAVCAPVVASETEKYSSIKTEKFKLQPTSGNTSLPYTSTLNVRDIEAQKRKAAVAMFISHPQTPGDRSQITLFGPSEYRRYGSFSVVVVVVVVVIVVAVVVVVFLSAFDELSVSFYHQYWNCHLCNRLAAINKCCE